MFTGIIKATGKLKKNSNYLSIEIIDNLFTFEIGDSIAVDGICLTVKEISDNEFSVDVSEETLRKTTLGEKHQFNSIVNLEPALRISDRIGGHIVSGHVDGLGEVYEIKELDKSWDLSIKWQDEGFAKFITSKGSICVNGVSLTIADYINKGDIFKMSIIPHTWHNTNLQYLKIGSKVNLEADTLIKYVEKLLKFNTNDKNKLDSIINKEWLNENGWNG